MEYSSLSNTNYCNAHFFFFIHNYFLYRLVHIGNLGWFVRNNHLNDDRNYKKAEILRVYQVLLGFSFFLYHGFLFMGFQNIIQLVFLASFISMVAEIIGSRTGIIFGGVYKYNSNKTPGIYFHGHSIIDTYCMVWFDIYGIKLLSLFIWILRTYKTREFDVYIYFFTKYYASINRCSTRPNCCK